jgi:hypothetical protein
MKTRTKKTRKSTTEVKPQFERIGYAVRLNTGNFVTHEVLLGPEEGTEHRVLLVGKNKADAGGIAWTFVADSQGDDFDFVPVFAGQPSQTIEARTCDAMKIIKPGSDVFVSINGTGYDAEVVQVMEAGCAVKITGKGKDDVDDPALVPWNRLQPHFDENGNVPNYHEIRK